LWGRDPIAAATAAEIVSRKILGNHAQNWRFKS
jgi:hypothetical protein